MTVDKIIVGDCLIKLKELEDNSIDSIVTDPPYELGFMGKSWDNTGIANNPKMWEECLRVLKPGGHLLAFSGTRTYHRMAVAIEDAGFEVRDMIEWVYGSGFPKSLNIAKSFEKDYNKDIKSGCPSSLVVSSEKTDYADGVNGAKDQPALDNEKWDNNEYGGGNAKCPVCHKWLISGNPCQCPKDKVEYKSELAQKWEGWGTALKPAHEPICLARKPLSEKTVALNCLKWGVGGINIDESRVKFEKGDEPSAGNRTATFGTQETISGGDGSGGFECNKLGRFPANLIHDNSEEVVELFPNSKGNGSVGGGDGGIWTKGNKQQVSPGYVDNGSAARFFYCAKASKSERNRGCDGLPTKEKRYMATANGTGETSKGMDRFTTQPVANNHPTVKPIALMEYLVKMVTPKGGIVLDPFAGSGSTLVAAKQNGFQYIGIEMTEEYIPIIEARLNAVKEIQLNLLKESEDK